MKQLLIISILFLSLIGNWLYGQITESFELWTDAGYAGISNATLASGDWENNNALLGSFARTGSKGVRFNDDSGGGEYL